MSRRCQELKHRDGATVEQKFPMYTYVDHVRNLAEGILAAPLMHMRPQKRS